MNGIPGDLPLKASHTPSRPAPASTQSAAGPSASPADPVDSASTSRRSRAAEKGPRVSREELLRLVKAEEEPAPPSGPVADLYATLGKAGQTASPAQVRHAIENFEQHREALVRFQESPEQVYSFASADELKTFIQARQDPSQLPEGTRALHQDLATVEDRGGSLMFGRKAMVRTEWLSTDAAGATVLLERGEPVVAIDRYGEVARLDKPADAAALARTTPAGDAARDDVVSVLKTLEERGFQVGLDEVIPEEVKATDVVGMAKHKISQALHGMITHDPAQDPLQQKRLAVESLAAKGVVLVAPPAKGGSSDEEDAPEPASLDLPGARPLNLEQLRDLAGLVEGRPTPEQKQFLDDMKTLRESRKSQVFSRETATMDRGALHKANDLVAWMNLKVGGEIVLLNPDGTMAHLDTLDQVREYAATGKVTHPAPPPVDPGAPKTNLLMLYYDAPFDPGQKGGIFEDTPLRAAQVGSNAQLDLVTLRSDLPKKQNLRQEYLQTEDMQLVQKLDPKTLMNNPKTLEDFVYQSLKAHPDDKHYRLMVAGHGGAELGLLPDGDANDASAHGAMPVDDFAEAVHRGLERFNQETGQDRKIDNLVVGSCLMGNTSFIHALAKRGDIRVLSASPETLMGNDPNVIFQYLADPKTADRSAEEFASDLVELLEGAAAFPGGRKNLQFADTFGAYDLSPEKGKKLEDSLSRFFQAVTDAPEFAKYVKEDIAACPTYGVNRIVNFQFGINQRDIIEVAERVLGDARVKSDEIKAAAHEVVASTEAVVLKQKMSERYSTRRGPTLYLPVETFAMDERLTQTSLLKSTGFTEFVKLVGEQPMNRTLLESLGYEIDRVMSGMRKASHEQKPPAPAPAPGAPADATPAAGTAKPKDTPAAPGDSTPAAGTAKPKDTPAAPGDGTSAAGPATKDIPGAPAAGTATKDAAGAVGAEKAPAVEGVKPSEKSSRAGGALADLLGQGKSDEDQEIAALARLEKTYRPWYAQVYRYAVATPLVMAATAAGAVAGAALGAVVATPVGTLLGLHAGLTGRSVAQRMVDGTTNPAHDGAEPPTSSPAAPAEPPAAPTASKMAPPPSSPAGTSPAAEDPSAARAESPLDGIPDSLKKSILAPVVSLATQAALTPMELGGELINRKASYEWGNGVGRAAGATLGTVAGAVGGGVAGAVVGGVAGGMLARGIARAILHVND